MAAEVAAPYIMQTSCRARGSGTLHHRDITRTSRRARGSITRTSRRARGSGALHHADITQSGALQIRTGRDIGSENYNHWTFEVFGAGSLMEPGLAVQAMDHKDGGDE
ncbi:hypothetical protein STEG23_002706, partial [Scotinomys teguina]